MARHYKRKANLVLHYGFDEIRNEYFYDIKDYKLNILPLVDRRGSGGLTNIELAEKMMQFDCDKEHITLVLNNKKI